MSDARLEEVAKMGPSFKELRAFPVLKRKSKLILGTNKQIKGKKKGCQIKDLQNKHGRWVEILMNYPHGARKKERKKEGKKDHYLLV